MSLTDLFIGNAYAQDAATSGGGVLQLLPLFVLVLVFYLLILRPQQKRTKEQKAMLDALQKGDEIVTLGGELGRVVKVGENYLAVEIAENVTVHIQRSAVQIVLPKGTIKSI